MMTTMGFVALSGAAVLAVAALANRGLDKSSASLRHLVWTAALGALVAIPLLEASGVRVELPVPGPVLGLLGEAPAAASVQATVESPEPVWAEAAPETAPDRVGAAATEEGRAPMSAADETSRRASRSAAAPVSSSGLSIGPAAPHLPSDAESFGVTGEDEGATGDRAPVAAGEARQGSWTLAGFAGAVWWLGCLVLLSATLFSHLEARRLTRRDTRRPSAGVCRRFAALCVELGIERPVRIVVSSRIPVPATWGLGRSTVVLPDEYEAWSPETLERVLRHELAHVARADCWSYLVGDVARALHWPNPLVWLAIRGQRLESERACDDRVLGQGGLASAYAEDLVTIVRALRPEPGLPRAALAMADAEGLGARVRAILDPARSRRGVRASTVGAVVGLTLVGVALATLVTPVAMAQERPELPVPPAPPTVIEHPNVPLPPPIPEPLLSEAPVLPAVGETVPLPVPEPLAVPQTDEAWLDVAPVLPSKLADRLGSVITWATSPPTPQERLCVFQREGRRSSSTSVDDDRIRIRWETDDCRVDVDIEGRVDFSPDDTGVESMERGALFELEERIGRTSRRVRLDGESGGRIERRYWVDGDVVAWSSEAELWMAQILPELFRHTTINAEARVRRMLADGGPERVFEEVELIHSDHVKGRYLNLVMEHAELTDAQYRRVIDAAGEIESDHQSGVLLLSVVERAGMRPGFQDALLQAAEGIESDHQKTMVLQALLESPLTAGQFDAVVRSASTIESDHSLSMLLSTVASEGRLSDAGRAAFMESLGTIESDHSHGVVVEAFLDAGPVSDEELAQVLAMTEGIDSDHTRGMILQRIAREYPLTGPQVDEYLRRASEIGSDHQKAMTAIAVIDRPEFGDEHVPLVLALADDIDSDHQRGQVLTTLVHAHDLDAGSVERVLAVVLGFGSDHQAAVALTALIEDEELDAEGVYSVLRVAGEISSDHQRATVMMTVARRHDIEGRSRDLYQELAEEMSSHNRNQVLAALVRRR